MDNSHKAKSCVKKKKMFRSFFMNHREKKYLTKNYRVQGEEKLPQSSSYQAASALSCVGLSWSELDDWKQKYKPCEQIAMLVCIEREWASLVFFNCLETSRRNATLIRVWLFFSSNRSYMFYVHLCVNRHNFLCISTYIYIYIYACICVNVLSHISSSFCVLNAWVNFFETVRKWVILNLYLFTCYGLICVVPPSCLLDWSFEQRWFISVFVTSGEKFSSL